MGEKSCRLESEQFRLHGLGSSQSRKRGAGFALTGVWELREIRAQGSGLTEIQV